MPQRKVEANEEKGPSGLSATQLLRISEVLKVLVIGDDVDCVGCPFQVVLPCFESTNDGKEFFVVDIVVALRLRQ